ncbi:hypothetical protein VJ923_02475 [Adlercreutzia sp. R25]|uniref:Uncharacterized protein n=1 Tax=Adlercreutzia shanghongiae TaxID=3111773 RepID=A0ABU6IVL5_9ACTN|nr:MULTISPECIES: hypothetical protein [unclassified Adlercreutzia]MEC4272027.1 hypothetical protein [Adlercreutzia sp. R25]MEC4293758.1 hypothetical protein [Adlercreutzia sp. R22]
MNKTTSLPLKAAVISLGLAAACLMLVLPGCMGGSQESAGKPDAVGNRAAETPAPSADAGEVISTAMVAYADDDTVLFVDQETGAPYFPTLIDDAVVSENGAEIDADDLVAGNLVQVTGNGIMLESYPGQYPGITKVEVISQGTPADADQYAALVAEVIATPDPSAVPTGYVEYTTDLAQTSVVLNPFDYHWVVPGDNGNNSEEDLDGEAADASGALASDIIDARIPAAIDAVAGFSATPTNATVERKPLTNEGDAPTVDPAAEDEMVPSTLQADGTVAFTIEPGYLYEIETDYAQGEASYAFYTLS